MDSASSLLSEEEFLCPICLEVFNDPVTTPCGHNYCKACITQYWDSNDRCHCLLCKKHFHTRPDLFTNTSLSEMAAQSRKTLKLKNTSSPDQQPAKTGEVSCDFCSGTKALKSCLVCLVSYCEIHLEPHQRVAVLKRHTLIDPVENLEDRMCKKHQRPLELFCKTDEMCVCQLCKKDHKLHHIVPLEDEYEGKKAQLGKTEAEVQQMIQKRQLKIQEIKHSVEFSKKDADREIADSVQVYTALVASIERSQAELIEVIEEKQKTTEKQAEGFIKGLEQEITELKKMSTELEQLSHTEDHLHLLQSFPSLSTPPHTEDWTKVKVHKSPYVGTVRRTVAQLEENLSQEMKKQLDVVELKNIQQYSVDVTLDPDTAHNVLILSEDGKRVYQGDVKKNVPDNPKRFSTCVSVLGKQSFSSEKFYYEVNVKGKTKWDLGVARESINRKGKILVSPTTGFWVICMRNENEYKAFAGPSVLLSLREKPQKVGVFVDYEEGLVSFYDVEARAHIYSFTGCTFTEKLYPYLSPGINGRGQNPDPLIISPANKTKRLIRKAVTEE